MKYSLILFLLGFILLFSCNEGNEQMNELKIELNSLSQKYAPDARTSIFKYEIQSGKNITLNLETNHKEAIKELEKYLSSKNIKIEFNTNFLPEEKLGNNTFGIIDVSVANIRSKPKHSAELATQALLGTVVNVLKKKNGWYLVQTPDEYIAWIDDGALTLIDSTERNNYLKSEKIFFTGDYGFSYKTPARKSLRVSDLVIGDILLFDGDVRNYFKVKYPDGRKAYVHKKESVRFSDWLKSVKPTAEKIIDTAKTFLGIPYLWGGTSAKGFDCSGFTKTVYFLNGLILPRDASQQALIGELIDTTVNLDKFKPGDLLFFGRKATKDKPVKVVHVGIYLGNGEFIHASGKVKINSLNKSSEDFNNYRYNTFLFARKMLNTKGEKSPSKIKNNKFYR